MKVHFGGRLFLAAAMASAVAVVTMGFLISLGVHSVVAGPGAGPSGPVPTPVGHAWTELQGHGDDGSTIYISTQDNQALELRVNNARALRLEPNLYSPNVIGGDSGNTVTSGAYGAAICGGGYFGYTNRVTDHFGTVGGGRNNQAGDGSGDPGDAGYGTVGGGDGNTASAWYATVGGGQVNTASGMSSAIGGGSGNQASADTATVAGGGGNIASGIQSTIGGGDMNDASGTEATVGGGYMNDAGGYFATIPGGSGNTASAQGATVGGGYMNIVTDNYGTVAGGGANQAGDPSTTQGNEEEHATVSGGRDNTASGHYSTVAGGYSNTASANASTVGGGDTNTASGGTATVGGGAFNTASGQYSTVPGGGSNTAQGDYSFAAGRQAKANHPGAFVWADSTAADLPSTTADQFLVRATGGVSLNVTSGGLRLQSNATSPNVVGGYSGNTVTTGAYGAAICGGGSSANTNSVTDTYGTVGGGNNNRAGDGAGSTSDKAYATVAGGFGNTASGQYSTVSGGETNTASGTRATVGGGSGNTASLDYATVGGGYLNTASTYQATVSGGRSNTASGSNATVGGGYINTASGINATVAGGTLNTAQGSYSFAAGRRAKANHQGAFVWADSTDADFASTTADQFLVRATGGVSLEVTSGGLRLQSNATSPNVIGGYSGNTVTTGAYGAAICGGGSSGLTNRVTDNYGTVGGGYNNQAGDGAGTTSDRLYATVAGGRSNTASGYGATVGGGAGNSASGVEATVGGGDGNLVTDDYGTVGGGYSNRAGDGAGTTSDRPYATVAGGRSNTASGQYATVGGGNNSEAAGNYSTVPGGYDNDTATGATNSFAAGNRAKANNIGCFVWSDSSIANDFTCSNTNRFLARAAGGVYLYTSSDLLTGNYITAGTSGWNDVSDRNVKENFTPVDSQAVLASLAEVPITTWNFKAQEDSSIRHMGAMAQDLYAAFGLGDDERHINTLDADGVALAAIQGLYALSQKQATRIDTLEDENASLQQRLDDLETRVTALEGGAPLDDGSAGPLASMMPGGWLVLGALLVLGGLVLAQRRLAGGRS